MKSCQLVGVAADWYVGLICSGIDTCCKLLQSRGCFELIDGSDLKITR